MPSLLDALIPSLIETIQKPLARELIYIFLLWVAQALCPHLCYNPYHDKR